MKEHLYIEKLLIFIILFVFCLGMTFALPVGIFFTGDIHKAIMPIVIVLLIISFSEAAVFFILWRKKLFPITKFLKDKEHCDESTNNIALLRIYNSPYQMMFHTIINYFIPSVAAGIIVIVYGYPFFNAIKLFVIGFIFATYALPVILSFAQNYFQSVTDELYQKGAIYDVISDKTIKISLVHRLALVSVETMIIFAICGYLIPVSIIPIIVAVIFSIIINIIVFNSYSKQMKHLEYNVRNIIDTGSLDSRIKIYIHDETSNITNLFNELLDMLLDMLGKMVGDADKLAIMADNLSSSTEEMNASVEEISATVQEIARGASQQAEDTVKMNENSENLSEISESVVSQIKRANIAAVKARNAAGKGKDGTEDVKEAMGLIYTGSTESQEGIMQLKRRSEEIDEIIDVIKNITGQTDLLALNASIEAARVGEYGAGFAVVAEEIRNLANSSQESTEKISKLINDIKSNVDIVVESMTKVAGYIETGKQNVDESKDNFMEIEKNVAITEDMIKEVTEAVNKQNDLVIVLAEKNKNLADISNETAASTEETSASLEEQMASMQEISASAAELHKLAQDLRNSEKVSKKVINERK
jgi:methyl-accepting chemotaxis protein